MSDTVSALLEAATKLVDGSKAELNTSAKYNMVDQLLIDALERAIAQFDPTKYQLNCQHELVPDMNTMGAMSSSCGAMCRKCGYRP